MLEVSFQRVEKVVPQQIVLRFTGHDLLDCIPVEVEKHGAGIPQDNRRVSRDKELRVTGLFKHS